MSRIQQLKIITLSTFLVLISACSHIPANNPHQGNPVEKTEVEKTDQKNKPKEEEVKAYKIRPDQAVVKESVDDYNKFVKKNHQLISSRAKQSYHKGIMYKSYIESVAEQHDLPEEIYALAAIESDFNPKIRSNVNSATGMWQLMPALSRDMGLVVNKKVDERKDWKKSTNAALKHLGESKERFDSHEVAVLSYYSGVGKVDKAIKKNNSNDIWVLLEDKETFGKPERDFIYKYMAYEKEFKKLNNQQNKTVNQ